MQAGAGEGHVDVPLLGLPWASRILGMALSLSSEEEACQQDSGFFFYQPCLLSTQPFLLLHTHPVPTIPLCFCSHRSQTTTRFEK